MRKALLIFVAILVMSSVCFCAEEVNAASPKTPLFSRLEVFGGYSYVPLSNGATGTLNTNGWGAAMTYNVNRRLGLTADFSGQYGGKLFAVNPVFIWPPSTTHVHNFLLGPTFTYRKHRNIAVFAHGLLGDSRMTMNPLEVLNVMYLGTSSRNAFAIDTGAGIDLKLNNRSSLRIAQFDFMHSSLNYNDWISTQGLSVFGAAPTSQNHFRYSTGIVIKVF